MSDRIEAIKKHVKRNKKLYIGVGVGLLVGVTTTTLILVRKSDVSVNVSPRGIFYKSPVITEVHLERRGHPGNVVRCVETGEIFASQNRAADLLGLSPTTLARHLKGDSPHVKGLTFEVIGVAQ